MDFGSDAKRMEEIGEEKDEKKGGATTHLLQNYACVATDVWFW